MKVPYITKETGRTGYRFTYPIPRRLVPLYGATKIVRTVPAGPMPQVVAAAEAHAADAARVVAHLANLAQTLDPVAAEVLRTSGGYKRAKDCDVSDVLRTLAAKYEARAAALIADATTTAGRFRAFELAEGVAAVSQVVHGAAVALDGVGTTCAGLVDVWARHTYSRDKDARRKIVARGLRVFEETPGIGPKAPGAVTRADVRTFRDAMKAKPGGYKHFQVTAKCFELAWKDEEIQANPFAGYELHAVAKTGDDAKRPYTAEEVAKIKAALRGRDDDFARVWAVLMTSGCRSGEPVKLLRSDVGIVDGVFCYTFRDTKGGGVNRVVPVHPAMVETVKAWRDSGEAALLFPTYRKNPHNFQQKSSVWLDEVLPGAKGVSTHSSRHTVATWMSDAHVNARTVKAIIGHKDKSMTGRYTHIVAKAVMLKALEVVPGWL